MPSHGFPAVPPWHPASAGSSTTAPLALDPPGLRDRLTPLDRQADDFAQLLAVHNACAAHRLHDVALAQPRFACRAVQAIWPMTGWVHGPRSRSCETAGHRRPWSRRCSAPAAPRGPRWRGPGPPRARSRSPARFGSTASAGPRTTPRLRAAPSRRCAQTVSPPCSPARSATEPATGLARMALAFVHAHPVDHGVQHDSQQQVGRRPGRQMAARDFSGWVLKARWRSSAPPAPRARPAS